MDVAQLGRTPIPGENPSGIDAKYEAEYASVTEEIGKLGSATQGGTINWNNVAQHGQCILETKSKDLQIAAYVAIAWQEIDGLSGFANALELYQGLFDTFWESAFPPLAKMRRRVNAFDWWHERAYQGLEKILDAPAAREFIEKTQNALSALDERAGELMPDALPLRDLADLLRRIPFLAEDQPSAVKTEPEGSEDPAVPKESGQSQQPAAAEPEQAEKNANAGTPENANGTSSKSSGTTGSSASTDSGRSDSPEDLASALKEFSRTGVHYALLAHHASPEDPLPWQILRLSLWGKVYSLPPNQNGETHIPPPDADRLAGLRRLLEGGKYHEVILAGEDFFPSSIFSFDVQCIVDTALGELGEAFASARASLREELLRFLSRLPGIEQLRFDGGMPFADEATSDWLESLSCTTGNAVDNPVQQIPTGDAFSEVFLEADRLASEKKTADALRLLETAAGVSPSVNMKLNVRALRILSSSGEKETAYAHARSMLDSLTEWRVESWDVDLALEVLLAVRDVFSNLHKKEEASAVQVRIVRLRPSSALGWKA
ncbi:MAG: type VI secretion system protein TssA [Desulfovibrio sp.]|nr:type VI secretion system protein TssA [Desulfovibrio sp.]